MKILLHICCGPCVIYPLRVLREMGHDPTGYYFNPNIHPYLEYRRRADALSAYAAEQEFPVIWADNYEMENFFRLITGNENDRCRICYTIRMRKTAELAKDGGFFGFTTTLLYSRFQKHDIIRSIGENLGQESGIPFFYFDFRQGWGEGVRISRQMGMYRQSYCGCIYSEKERFYPLGRGDN